MVPLKGMVGCYSLEDIVSIHQSWIPLPGHELWFQAYPPSWITWSSLPWWEEGYFFVSSFPSGILWHHRWCEKQTLEYPFTSSTAQGGGGSFKNRKPIGELGCCESRMAERSHWWTDRWLRSRLFLSLSVSFSDYLPTYPPIYLCIHLSLSLSLSVYLSN